MRRSTDCSTLRGQHTPLRPKRRPADVHLEPLPGLEWSLAVESEPEHGAASSPAALRKGWIHRADESQVLHLFRKLNRAPQGLPAPWWLKALDRGELPSRAAAFAVEDAVHSVLSTRRGWVFVPWAGPGETGYWEYDPSSRSPVGTPTTVLMTDAHRGWVSAVAAHVEDPPEPVAVDGTTGLLRALARIESW